jgi:hypothetical protein
MLNEGAVVSTFNEIEKQKWVDQLPDIAGRWAQALSQRGVNGNEVMNAFMRAVKTRIGPPLKDWTIKVE